MVNHVIGLVLGKTSYEPNLNPDYIPNSKVIRLTLKPNLEAGTFASLAQFYLQKKTTKKTPETEDILPVFNPFFHSALLQVMLDNTDYTVLYKNTANMVIHVISNNLKLSTNTNLKKPLFFH